MPERNDDRDLEFLEDPHFQRKFHTARDLDWDEVELAFRHGFDARERFADRPFDEVVDHLRTSWEGMAPPKPWDDVKDIVESGYSRYKGAGFGSSTDLASEALEQFPQRTSDGSHLAGRADRAIRAGGATPTTARPAGGAGPIPSGAPATPEGDAGTAGEAADRSEA